MADRALGEDCDIGRAATDIDQHHAQFFFVGGQHCISRGHWLQNQVSHFEAAAPHALDDVLHRRHRTGHDVHLDLEANAAHADGLADIFLVVDDEFLRHRMQQLLVGRNVDRLGRFDHPCHIGRVDFLVLDRNHAAGVETPDMATGDASPDVTDLAVGHQLGLLERPLYRLDRGLNIDHDALFEALRFALAETDDLVTAVRQYLGDHSDHL